MTACQIAACSNRARFALRITVPQILAGDPVRLYLGIFTCATHQGAIEADGYLRENRDVSRLIRGIAEIEGKPFLKWRAAHIDAVALDSREYAEVMAAQPSQAGDLRQRSSSA